MLAVAVEGPGAYTLKFNFFRQINNDQLPRFESVLSAEDLLREQELHPRAARWLPDWFLAALSLAGQVPLDAPLAPRSEVGQAPFPAPQPSTINDPRLPGPRESYDTGAAEPMTFGDFMRLENELREGDGSAFLERYGDDLARFAAEFRRLTVTDPSDPIAGLGNLLTAAFRGIRDEERQSRVIRELLAAGWPVTTARTGDYNEITILLDELRPLTPEHHVELILLLLNARCHPALMDRFGDRPITKIGAIHASQQDLARIYDQIFSRDDLDLARIASDGSTAIQEIRRLRRAQPELANRALTWMKDHGMYTPPLGADVGEPLIL